VIKVTGRTGRWIRTKSFTYAVQAAPAPTFAPAAAPTVQIVSAPVAAPISAPALIQLPPPDPCPAYAAAMDELSHQLGELAKQGLADSGRSAIVG
jgi:hypothetical protein